MQSSLVSRVLSVAVPVALVLSMGAGVHANAQNRQMIIDNETSSPLWHLYASPVRYSNPFWGGDRLGDGAIGAGHYWVMDMSDGTGYCRYDFLAITLDGQKYWAHDVNVCTESKVTISD